MNTFSVFDYEKLPDSSKAVFNKALAQKLTSLINEIKNDDVLGTATTEEFIKSSGEINNSATLVADLYSKISSGIQVGSGNQNLFNAILAAYTNCWAETIK